MRDESAASTPVGDSPGAAADSIDRYRRLQAAMAAAGVDAVLFSRWAHGFAVSGARRVQVGGSGGGAPWVIVTRGAPVPHVFTPDPDGVPGWIPAGVVHPLRWDPDVLARDVAGICAHAVIGSGRAPRIAYDVLSVGMLDRLARELPGARFEDAQPVLAQVRRAKSDSEVAALRHAHDKAARAAAAAGAAFHPEGCAADVEARAYEQMAVDGIGFPLAEVGLWVVPGIASAAPSRARSRPFAVGTRLTVDVVVSDGGVCGRALRTFVCGRPPTVEEEALGRCWQAATGRIAAVLRPGGRVEHLRDAIAAVATAEASVARIELLAHGVGIGVEPPFMRLAWFRESHTTGGEPRPNEAAGSAASTHQRSAAASGVGSTLEPGEQDLAENAVLLVAPKVVCSGAGEIWASETMVVTRDGGRALGATWRPWSVS